MDILHKFLKFLDHHRYTVMGFVVVIVLGGWLVGCSVKTTSILDQTQKVTQVELEREVLGLQRTLDEEAAAISQREELYNIRVRAINKEIEAAEGDIAAQVEKRAKLIELAGSLGTAAVSGTINPAVGIAAAIQALTLFAGGGAILDSKRKNAVIAKLKNGNDPA